MPAGRGERAASAGGGGRRPLSRRSVRGHRGPPRRPLRPPPAPRSKSGFETAPAQGSPAPGPAPYLGRAPRSCLKGQRALQRRKHWGYPLPATPHERQRKREGICLASIPFFPHCSYCPALCGLVRLKTSWFLLPLMRENVPMMPKRYSALKKGPVKYRICAVPAQRPCSGGA